MAVNVVSKVDGPVPVRHALVSVSDKTGLESFIPGLLEVCKDLTILSTGGTFTALANILGGKASRHLRQVSEYTGQPETQGGLVKTLDFKIYLGLLTERYNDSHQRDLLRTSAVPIDLVVVNLYPFTETIAKPGITPEQARGQIDIGGPCMIRAAAKNFLRTAPAVDPDDYGSILEELRKNNGATSLRFRFRMAKKAFRHTAAYDRAIADYLIDTPYDAVAPCYTIVS